jgi:CrcB protein
MTAPDTESVSAPRQPAWRTWRTQAPIVAVVALGGAVGATARYAASLWWPAQPGGFPWATFWINVVGCAMIGVLMVIITEVRTAHRLVRPFVDSGHPSTGLAYLAATLIAALTAVWLATAATRRVLKRRQP